MFYKWGVGWDTNDGTIPHRLFLLLLSGTGVMESGDELRLARGTALGAAIAFAGKDNEVQGAIRGLAKEAFPEVFDGPDR